MKAKYSYFRIEYGRHAGKKNVVRYCRVDQNGKVSYAEKRTNTGKDAPPFAVDMYKLGNTVCVVSPLHNILPSTKAEFIKMVKEAMKNIL